MSRSSSDRIAPGTTSSFLDMSAIAIVTLMQPSLLFANASASDIAVRQKAERHNAKLRTAGKSPHTHFGYGR